MRNGHYLVHKFLAWSLAEADFRKEAALSQFLFPELSYLRLKFTDADLLRNASQQFFQDHLGVGHNWGSASVYPSRFSVWNRSSASRGFVFLCTTAWTAAIIAFGASDWKMLRPISTPDAPCWTAL